MQLSDKEKQILHDTEFLLTKASLIKKISSLMESVHIELREVINNSGFDFGNEIDIVNGKIFKGENYRELPYVVLDYPKKFSNKDTFALRTMFWWGNYFSTTLHLEGDSLSQYQEFIIKNSAQITNNEFFCCVNHTQWEYHYDQDNYELLGPDNKDLLKRNDFLKISKKYQLDSYSNLPILASNFLNDCLKLLNN